VVPQFEPFQVKRNVRNRFDVDKWSVSIDTTQNPTESLAADTSDDDH